MERVIAAILALMLLLSAGALAEKNAAVMTLDNVCLQDKTHTVKVRDYAVSLVLENINDLPSLALLIDGAGEPLATAIAQLSTEQVILAVDGMDHGYKYPIPAAQAAQLAQVGEAGLAALIPSLVSTLDEMELPTFTGVDVPKLDMTDALSAYVTGTDNGVSAFEIPVTEFDKLLDEVLTVAKSQGNNVSQIDKLNDMIEAMKAEGKGFAVKGTITDDGTTQKVDGEISLVSGRKATGVAALSIVSAMNSWRLAISVRKGFLNLNVLTASMIARPAEERIDVGVSVFGGMDFAMGIFQENGLQKITFDATGLGQKAWLEIAYGKQADGDLVSLVAQLDAMNLTANLKTAMGADGVRKGTLTYTLNNNSNVAGISADVTMYTGEGPDLSGIVIPTKLKPIDQLDKKAINKAFEPVKTYIANNTTLS